jgi:RND family efflux transporter MFP subunit
MISRLIRMHRFAAWLAIAWLGGLSLIGPADSVAGGAALVKVRVVKPIVEKNARTVAKFAYTEPLEKADIFVKASGYLKEVKVDLGARVSGPVLGPDGQVKELGTLLAVIDAPELKQELEQKKALEEQANAELAQAKAALASAEATVKATAAAVKRHEAEVKARQSEERRFHGLWKNSLIPLEQYEEKQHMFEAAQAGLEAAKANVAVEEARRNKAKADVDSAAARIKVAQASRQLAEVQWGYHEVRAPYDGLITRRYKHSGDFVQSAQAGKPEPLFTIVRSGPLRIVTDLPEPDAVWVRVGQPAVFQPDSVLRERFTGKVVRIADALDPQTRTMRVEVQLDDKNAALRPGVSGAVTITFVPAESSLTLPSSAVRAQGEKHYVMTVREGVARRVSVEVGYSDGSRAWITSGLAVEDSIVIEAEAQLQDGQPVAVAP